MVQPIGTGLAANEIRTWLQRAGVLVRQIGEDRPEAPSQPVALDSMAHAPPDGECEPGRERIATEDRGSITRTDHRVLVACRFIGQEGDPDRPGTGPDPLTTKGVEGGSVPDAPDQADSLWRPFRRRARMTARPPRVDMRFRKPCFLARLRTLGWNVRFTENLLGPRGPMSVGELR